LRLCPMPGRSAWRVAREYRRRLAKERGRGGGRSYPFGLWKARLKPITWQAYNRDCPGAPGRAVTMLHPQRRTPGRHCHRGRCMMDVVAREAGSQRNGDTA